jgi:hypothetical protein
MGAFAHAVALILCLTGDTIAEINSGTDTGGALVVISGFDTIVALGSIRCVRIRAYSVCTHASDVTSVDSGAYDGIFLAQIHASACPVCAGVKIG